MSSRTSNRMTQDTALPPILDREAQVKCKICGNVARFVFDMPASRQSGDANSMFNAGPRANYYECESCQFLFSDVLDDRQNFYETEFTGKAYLESDDVDIQNMRLLYLAATVLNKPLFECRVLDFGCGTGHFVNAARRFLEIEIFGYDLAVSYKNLPYILNEPPAQHFDIVISREVVEHFTDPLGSFQAMKAALKPIGVIAFQTSEYDPKTCTRDWDYIGPNNGHVSLYSRGALDVLKRVLKVDKELLWKSFPIVAAWRISKARRECVPIVEFPILLSDFCFPDPSVFKNGVIEFEMAPGRADRMLIIYGPYATLDKGHYRLRIDGEMNGKFEIRIRDHRGAFYSKIVSKFEPQLDFDLPCNTWGWELVIMGTEASENLRISSMSVQQIDPKGSLREPMLKSTRRKLDQWLRRAR